MGGRGSKILGALLVAMLAVLVVAVLTAIEVIDLPGHLRTTLGLREETPNPPCHRGLYRRSPASPPAPAGHWRSEPPIPKTPVEGNAAAVGSVVYMLGGSAPGNLHRALAYDTRTGRWREPTKLPTGLNHSHPVVYRGDIYLAGGYLEGAEAISNFWQYDPRSRRWTRMPPMPRPVAASGTAVADGKLYVADGAPQVYGISNPGDAYNTLEIYDFTTGQWSLGPNAPIAVHHVGAAALGGKIYLAGGRTDPERSANELLRYDPAAERWERLPNLPQGPISSVGMVAARGKVVVFGGDDELGWKDGGGSVTPSAWAFDPRSSRWQRLPDMRLERHAFGAAVADGRIYAIAGSYCPGLKLRGPVGTHSVESLPLSALAGR